VTGQGAVLRVSSTRAVGKVAAVATIWGSETRIAKAYFALVSSHKLNFVGNQHRPCLHRLASPAGCQSCDRGGRGMDSDELVSILKQKFQGVDREVIRAVLEDNDNRLAAAEEALRAVATRQGSSGTGPSGRPVRLSCSAEISAWRSAFLGRTATLAFTQPSQHGNHAPESLCLRSHPRGSVCTGADLHQRLLLSSFCGCFA